MSRNCSVLSAMVSFESGTSSGRAAQVLDQRIDGGRFGLHHPELADVGAKVIQDLLRPGAAGLGHVLLDQPFQVLQVRLHGLRVNPADVDELVVVAVDEVTIEIQYVRESAREPGTEVDAGASQHADNTARHVLTTVIAGTLDDRDGARIAHGKALARDTGSKQL